MVVTLTSRVNFILENTLSEPLALVIELIRTSYTYFIYAL